MADREEISRGLTESLENKEFGAQIGRDPSVGSREVARHGDRDGYRAVIAERGARSSRSRPKPWAVDARQGGETAIAALVERTSRFVMLVP
ncbi:hypothetical protein GCM10010390_48660 [Streptomyces mordarskii]|uniref:Transposase n=1 Tax=Streptomyces mordarskii TaxID=1226758 RepID=A0ABN1DDP4_9ACTN